MAKSLQDAGSGIREGIDRARAIAAVIGPLKKLKKTQRFKLGREFMEISKEREHNMPKVKKPSVSGIPKAS